MHLSKPSLKHNIASPLALQAYQAYCLLHSCDNSYYPEHTGDVTYDWPLAKTRNLPPRLFLFLPVSPSLPPPGLSIAHLPACPLRAGPPPPGHGGGGGDSTDQCGSVLWLWCCAVQGGRPCLWTMRDRQPMAPASLTASLALHQIAEPVLCHSHAVLANHTQH